MQLANPNATNEEMLDALSRAQADDIISIYGLDTDVGFRGSFLSGGQKQRIAIARALVKKPKVLVLDESTSALDNITENNFLQSIKIKNRTIISIAHRIQTIKDCDQILILEKGCCCRNKNSWRANENLKRSIPKTFLSIINTRVVEGEYESYLD